MTTDSVSLQSGYLDLLFDHDYMRYTVFRFVRRASERCSIELSEISSRIDFESPRFGIYIGSKENLDVSKVEPSHSSTTCSQEGR